MKMMPPDVISHENQLQYLSEPSIFMLDVFQTADHAGQIFIPHRQRSQTRDATDEQSLMIEDDPRPVGRRSKRISPRRNVYFVRRWYMQIVERPVTVRPRSLRWPTSAALQLLNSGGVQSSLRRPDRVYIKDGLDAVTWLANIKPFKSAKSAANSAKMPGTLT